MDGITPISMAPSAVAARYLRPSDAAIYAGLSESELRRAIYAGELPARKYRSRRWLIDIYDLEAYIERCSVSNVA